MAIPADGPCALVSAGCVLRQAVIHGAVPVALGPVRLGMRPQPIRCRDGQASQRVSHRLNGALQPVQGPYRGNTCVEAARCRPPANGRFRSWASAPIDAAVRQFRGRLRRNLGSGGGQDLVAMGPAGLTAVCHLIAETRAAYVVTAFLDGARPAVWGADRWAASWTMVQSAKYAWRICCAIQPVRSRRAIRASPWAFAFCCCELW